MLRLPSRAAPALDGEAGCVRPAAMFAEGLIPVFPIILFEMKESKNMNDDPRYTLPEPLAQPWLIRERDRDKPLNRRDILRKVLTGSMVGVAGGFQVLQPNPAAARYYRIAADKGWGGVKGRILWKGDGAAPKPREIDLSKYTLKPEESKWFTSKGPIYHEDWVVNEKNLGVRWVFAWLQPLTGGTTARLPVHPDLEKITKEIVEMEQPCSGFAPHTVALRAGQKLLVNNGSPIFHAFQWNGVLQSGNQAMAPGTKITIGDLQASRQPLRVSCAPHPWEAAWIRVFDHPYFTITDADGNFSIPVAPEGKHRLVVWHETAGWLGGSAGKGGLEVTVESGSVLDVGEVGLKAGKA